MKLSIPAIILVIVGILLLVGPWTFAPVCEVGGMYVKTATGYEPANAMRMDSPG